MNEYMKTASFWVYRQNVAFEQNDMPVVKFCQERIDLWLDKALLEI
jgi:hypothetical protein